MAINSRSKAFAESLAKVVLPTPGGPQRIIECGLPDPKARLSGLQLAKRCVCPMTSSIDFGRKTSANGGGGASCRDGDGSAKGSIIASGSGCT